MPIFDDVQRQLGAAMRARDSLRTGALRGIRAGFLTECKRDGSETLSDEACVAVLRRLEKQHLESIEAFDAAGRKDRADVERAELSVIRELAPPLADEATTRKWVEEAITLTRAREARDLGRVMGALMKAHKGEVDGHMARDLAGRLLSGG